ncbi:MAG: HIT domain-containing protein [Rhodospirillales bacterium]|jgi:diadenosine tetraphosphate (Ap4A) HIT family hydrolase
MDSEIGFILDTRLANDCHKVTDLELSHVLLMNDERYPWLILVPRRKDIREIHHLSTHDRNLLFCEIIKVSEYLERKFQPIKLNIGALGNIVSQLHIHILARNANDAAWPGPVWGHSTAVPYSAIQLERLKKDMTKAFI